MGTRDYFPELRRSALRVVDTEEPTRPGRRDFFRAVALHGASIPVVHFALHSSFGGEISGGRLGQFVLYAVFAASALGQLSEVCVDQTPYHAAPTELGRPYVVVVTINMALLTELLRTRYGPSNGKGQGKVRRPKAA